MNTTHDDLPHPIPPIAWLRWKENYFFIILAPDQDVFGVAHLSYEPGFDRARFSCNLSIQGQQTRYFNQIAFPREFEHQRELGDDRMKVTIIESYKRFLLNLRTEDVKIDVTFDAHFPAYNFDASAYAAPELASFKEVLTLGTNLHYNHLQQAMRSKGTVEIGGKHIDFTGLGYRDHSWSMRSDGLVGQHTWCGFIFPERAFGIMTLNTLIRPELEAKEGYVVDAEGPRALRSINVIREDLDKDNFPARIIHEVQDVYGRSYRIETGMAKRFCEVPLDEIESAQGHGRYLLQENFCRSLEVGTGREGVSLIEIGRHSSFGNGTDGG